MGCDIHCYVEALKDGVWDFIDTPPPFYERNYNLFTIIGGVRDIGDNPYPMFPIERNLPFGVSEFVENESNKWGIDGHSHNYLEIQEILDYINQNNETKIEGYEYLIDRDFKLQYHSATQVDSIDRNDALNYFENNPDKQSVKVRYKSAYNILSYCTEFNDIYKYLDLINKDGYDNVRFVFWFDN